MPLSAAAAIEAAETGHLHVETMAAPQLSRCMVHRGRGARTAFGTLGALSYEMDNLADVLKGLQKNLETRPQVVTKAQKAVRKAFPGNVVATKEVAQLIAEKAALVKEKIDNFNERIDPVIQQALVFNEMVSEQSDWEYNELPDEMLEQSGTIIRNLQHAKKLGEDVLKPDSELLGTMATMVASKVAAVPLPALACAVLAPQYGAAAAAAAAAPPPRGAPQQLSEFL
eukprot:TRINITY_DN16698_c0_g1_i1.p2 TRINITY_DN16698_c0_g1~~TRINITY_DN16698_c0_g1_i1.p2  ORF type:complete len:227 (-),score=58.09 TRINITY_DN16698_c0_g1_i1:456-1136(-)